MADRVQPPFPKYRHRPHVIPSAAKDLLFIRTEKKQVLRFAQDDTSHLHRVWKGPRGSGISVLRFVLAVVLPALLSAPAFALDEPRPSEEEIGAIQIIQSEAEALAEIFPQADSVICDTMIVDSLFRDWLEKRLGRGIFDRAYVCYEVFANGRRLGTAVVADESGKYRPITFMAGVDPDLRIADVRVLIYRESRGGEVQMTRYLRQYRKKTLDNPIRINRDIINITGATISVNALNYGVRKALAVAEYRAATEIAADMDRER